MKKLVLVTALAAGLACASVLATTPEEAMNKAGCMACHSKD